MHKARRELGYNPEDLGMRETVEWFLQRGHGRRKAVAAWSKGGSFRGWVRGWVLVLVVTMMVVLIATAVAWRMNGPSDRPRGARLGS